MRIFNKIIFIPIGACLGLFVGYLTGFISIIIYNIPPMVGWWGYDIVGGIAGFFIGTIVSIIIIIIIRRTKKPRDKGFKKKRNVIAIILSIIIWLTLYIWSMLNMMGVINLHFLTYPLIISIVLIIYVVAIILIEKKRTRLRT
ncbi:MAG: hypothetical protein ACFFA7_11390 [Promethearchaeota archaeon]